MVSRPLPSILTEAVEHHQRGQLSEAAALYRAVLREDASQPDALNLLGLITAEAGDIQDALALFDRAIAAAPQVAAAAFNKGNVLHAAKRLDEARTAYQDALKADPDFHDARLNLGVLLQDNGETDAALEHFSRLAALDPMTYPSVQKAHYNIGKCRQTQGRLDDALTALTQALSLNPNDPDAHFACASVYAQMRQYERAVSHIKQAIKIRPEWPEAIGNLGNYLMAIDDSDNALEQFNKALALDPTNTTVRTNRGLLLLSLGRLSEGWGDYKHRAESEAPYYKVQPDEIAAWQGEDLSNKDVLIWNEQGLGEEILYAGLLHEFAELIGTGTLVCSPKLCTVFRRSFADSPNITVTDQPANRLAPAQFDVQLSLVDLGRSLRPSMASFPPPRGYLKWDQARTDQLRDDLESAFGADKLFIGLCWSSANPVIGQNKSIPLTALTPILTLPGSTIVNMQYGPATEELSQLPDEMRNAVKTINAVDLDGDLDETLSLLAAVDHLVTCSTTSAHLAGAAGLSTKVILPPADGRLWYWFSDGTKSPWYPDVHLFRQTATKSIESAVDQVRDDITGASPQIRSL